METTLPKKNRLVLVIVLVLVFLVGAGAVTNLFMNSLVTAEERHDHDGDGTPDH